MAWVTLGALSLVILFSGYSVFFPGKWSVSTFLTYYIDIAIFIGKRYPQFPCLTLVLTSSALWVGSWVFLRAKPVSLADMDLSEIYLIEQEKEEEILEQTIDWKTPSWWVRWLM